MTDTPFPYSDERFADIQMLRYRVPDFDRLSLRQKKLVYYLSEAALSGRDILWDQNCRFNLPVRRMLEAAYEALRNGQLQSEEQSEERQAFETYVKRVWFSNGIHHHYGCEKFKPGFSRDFLERVLKAVDYPIDETLMEVIFNPLIAAKRVNQTEAEDQLQTSAMNYYAPDVTQAEAERFYEDMKQDADPRPVMFGMNSRLEKDSAGGHLVERTWKSGGMYGKSIDRIVYWLELAEGVAESETQRQVIATLVDFYRTGDLRTFDQYCIQWVRQTEGDVDFTNGFIEVYGDPLGLKASWEGFVNIRNREATERTEILSRNAQWFEDNSPVDSRFKKQACRGVSAKVVTAAMLGGDLYPSSAIGINLPNSNWIRQEHGSKSVTIGNLTEAYNRAAHGNGFREEFVNDSQTLKLLYDYEDALDDLHTDLHECLGHGSGQLLPGIDPDALKTYGSAIEEARADLFALYYIADHKLVELGLTPDDEAYKSQYYSYMMNGLMTQLVRIEPGNQIEEAHMRNRALIAHWTMEHCGGAMQWTERQGKTYLVISDYAAIRKAVGQLLAEVQRIKSEGDYDAARNLVEEYGVKVDGKLHDEVLRRYRALNLAPYKGFINPRFNAIRNGQGEIVDIEITYGEPYDEQMLRYGKTYSYED